MSVHVLCCVKYCLEHLFTIKRLLLPFMQERAYFLLQMGHGGGGYNDTDRFYYEGEHLDIPGDDEEDQDEEEEEEDDDDEGEVGEDEEEEEEEVEEGEENLEEAGIEPRAATDDHIDGANFDSDEAYARALQDKEDRDTTARLMALAGIHDRKYYLLQWIKLSEFLG